MVINPDVVEAGLFSFFNDLNHEGSPDDFIGGTLFLNNLITMGRNAVLVFFNLISNFESGIDHDLSTYMQVIELDFIFFFILEQVIENDCFLLLGDLPVKAEELIELLDIVSALRDWIAHVNRVNIIITCKCDEY